MHYALLLVFQYARNSLFPPVVEHLPGAVYDLHIAVKMALSKQIQPTEITIITDLPLKCCESFSSCNVQRFPYPYDVFVCSEILHFIENTVKSFQDSLQDRIFIYISGHGGNIILHDIEDQCIILTNFNGTTKRYLKSNAIFDLLFGKNCISNEGKTEVKIYEKIGSLFLEMPIFLQVPPILGSPVSSSDHYYRRNYMSNRGLPGSAKIFIFIDTCFSGKMCSFPYSYNPKKKEMIINSSSLIYEDLPYCVMISSCNDKEKTLSSSKGSCASRYIFSRMMSCSSNLTISQLYCCIEKSFFLSPHPVISSTLSDMDHLIPFYDNNVQEAIIVITKS
jgi:hypothetical protein